VGRPAGNGVKQQDPASLSVHLKAIPVRQE
jgi:hypothetical protein